MSNESSKNILELATKTARIITETYMAQQPDLPTEVLIDSIAGAIGIATDLAGIGYNALNLEERKDIASKAVKSVLLKNARELATSVKLLEELIRLEKSSNSATNHVATYQMCITSHVGWLHTNGYTPRIQEDGTYEFEGLD